MINAVSFEWTIPNGFLSNYSIGQEIDFPKDEIPRFHIDDIFGKNKVNTIKENMRTNNEHK